jgi:hypothetical protein
MKLWTLNYLPHQSWIRSPDVFLWEFSRLHILWNSLVGRWSDSKDFTNTETQNKREKYEQCPERFWYLRSALEWSNVNWINLFYNLLLFLHFSWCNILLNTFVHLLQWTGTSSLHVYLAVSWIFCHTDEVHICAIIFEETVLNRYMWKYIRMCLHFCVTTI